MTVHMTDTSEKAEVIPSVQRRRRWSAAEKMRRVEERATSLAPRSAAVPSRMRWEIGVA